MLKKDYMQIFILGKTKSGKSTLAQIFEKHDYVTYEAGAWAREEFDQINSGSNEEFSSEFKENLTNYALGKLKEDCYYSVKKYEKFLTTTDKKNKVIIGVRNPDDFLQMLRMDKENVVVFINSKNKLSGSLELFEEGLNIIKEYIDWRKKLGNPIEFIEIDEKDITNRQLVIKLLGNKFEL